MLVTLSGWSARSLVLLVSITCTCSFSASSHRPWSLYVDARLFILVSVPLFIPHNQIKDILAVAYDDKHHFSEERMLYDLRGVSINNKACLVKKYVKHRLARKLNATDRQPPIVVAVTANWLEYLAVDIAVDIAVISKREKAYTKWQLTAYDKIAIAWQKLQLDYKARLAEYNLAHQNQGPLGGDSPDANRLIERTELKRYRPHSTTTTPRCAARSNTKMHARVTTSPARLLG
ncbi:hypothetical protein VTK56DRAFT_4698 [Thermocarpiscus australiensis]